jgi:murein DD-endopeptidase MepM/ murein hydrolase activator NlpD
MSLRTPAPRGIVKRLVAVAMALACALTLGAPAAVAADPRDQKRKVDREIAELKEQLHDTSADLAAAYLALRQTQAAMPAAQQRLQAAQQAVVEAEQRNDEMTAALEVARANEARAVDRLRRTNADIEGTRQQVARFAAQMYQDQGMGQLSVALSATSPDEFATRIAMADTVMSVQNRSLDRLAAAQAAATAQQAHVVALRKDVALAKAAAEKALASATAAREQAAHARQRLDTLAATHTRQAQQVEARKAVEQRRLAAMAAESQRLQRVLAARARAAKIAAAKAAAAKAARERAARRAAARSRKRYVPPAPSRQTKDGYLSAPSTARVSSEYGMRFHPVLRYWRLHAGRDYAGNCGSPVYAAASGTVISAGDAGGYGNQVVVAHGVRFGVDLATSYNHLSGFAVRGGRVSRGQVIGYVGTTGTSTGCHLHFEVFEDGTPVDPRRWL